MPTPQSVAYLEARRAAAAASRFAAEAIARAAETAPDTDAEAWRAFAEFAAAIAKRTAEPAGEPMRPPQFRLDRFHNLDPAPPPPPDPSPPKGRNLKTHATKFAYYMRPDDWRGAGKYPLRWEVKTLCGRWQSVDDNNALRLLIKELPNDPEKITEEWMEGITCKTCMNMICDGYLTGADWKEEMADRIKGWA